MTHLVSRRSFLTSCALSCGGVVFSTDHLRAAEPFRRTGPPRLLLSLAAYSFRQYFKDLTHEREPDVEASKRIDLFRFVDYCAEQGITGAELTSYYFPKETN